MNKKYLYWTPRALAILFAVFISLFALDVFGEGYSFWEAILGLLIHLIPTYILIFVIWVAWKWEQIGGILFILLGIAYIILTRLGESFITYLFMTGPLVVIGVLFLLNKVLNIKEK